jgi:hypothetical protein
VHVAAAKVSLADRLAAELKHSRDAGQPLIYEQTFPTGKSRVTVIWDDWGRVPLRERTATILRAYELAEGPDARERVALASGLTVPEAHAAGMLPYQIITALRRSDPMTWEQARQAVLEEGATTLEDPATPQLRFTTEEEAQAARQRLIRKFPGSDDVWLIHREAAAHDYIPLLDEASIGED